MRKKRSKILDAVHATARGLHAANAIDQVTMRVFDQLYLKPVPPLRPAEIKRIRESANVSQAACWEANARPGFGTDATTLDSWT